MKRIINITLLVLCAATASFAATPQLIDYQGYLMESGGAMTGSLSTTGNISASGTIAATTFSGNGAAITNVTPKDNSVTSAKVVDDSLTAADLNVNVVSSVEGVTNDGGNIDLVNGGGISIVADDAANTITLMAVAGAVDHNSLSNLTTGDPHTQYAKKATTQLPGNSLQHITRARRSR